MTETRIITISLPWAWAVIHAGKDIENRGHNIAGGYRGRVAIHTALKPDREPHARHSGATLTQAQIEAVSAGETSWQDPAWDDHAGHIIGVVDLVDVHFGGSYSSDCFELDSPVRVTCASPWGERDAYHLVLANPRALRSPIPFRGALGLRRLDEATTAQIDQEHPA